MIVDRDVEFMVDLLGLIINASVEKDTRFPQVIPAIAGG